MAEPINIRKKEALKKAFIAGYAAGRLDREEDVRKRESNMQFRITRFLVEQGLEECLHNRTTGTKKTLSCLICGQSLAAKKK